MSFKIIDFLPVLLLFFSYLTFSFLFFFFFFSLKSVLERVRVLVADERVTVRETGEMAKDASPISRCTSTQAISSLLLSVVLLRLCVFSSLSSLSYFSLSLSLTHTERI